MVTAPRGAAAGEPAGAWIPDEALVRLRADVSAWDVADRHGATVRREAGPAGWIVLGAPPGRGDALLDALARDPDVRACARHGRTYGATWGASAGGVATPGRTGQWHLHAANVPLDQPDLRGVVVAVLDTGVAYEERISGGRRFVTAPSLRGVRFVAPADFIERDAHPNDDHQHGTHIASLIASQGDVRGVAPGVSLLPIKVLDEQDIGTEAALIDGIHHAVRNGAHVINMSLSFGSAYTPSAALVEALERAAASGAVLVAAAGNEGTDRVTQPAANPLVLAVGALRPAGAGAYAPAPYANASPRVDLVAPGGSVDRDRDGDGLLDGLLAETIGLQDPSHVGWWLYAGTSQAAALVSGAAARLVALGLDAPAVRATLLAAAQPDPYAAAPFLDGQGRGRLDVAAAVARAATPTPATGAGAFVALLPWLEGGADGLTRASARATVLDEGGQRVPGAQVFGIIDGAGGGPVTCTTGEDGACRLLARWRAARSDDGWCIRVETVVVDGIATHPGAASFANAGFHALLRELRGARAAGAALAFRWRAGDDPELGRVADAVTATELQVARAGPARAFVFAPSAVDPNAAAGAGTLAIASGVGGATPIVRMLPADAGGGWGWRIWRARDAWPFDLFELDADALAGTPLGISARAVFGGQGRGLRPVLVGTGRAPGPLVVNRAAGNELADTPVGVWLTAGGWALPTSDLPARARER